MTQRISLHTAHKTYSLPETLLHYICWRCERVCCRNRDDTRCWRGEGVVALSGFEESAIFPDHRRPLCQHCWRRSKWM